MDPSIAHVVEELLAGRRPSAALVRKAVGTLMGGRADPVDAAALLTAFAACGENEDALVGAAQAMRDRAAAITVRRRPLLDTCGTGGDRLHTFNISTATAIVAAAAGVPVAKHGNRSVSSSSGSADVLQALGVRIDLSPEDVGRCIDEVGIGFCFAPLFHGAMKHVADVRRRLGFRTIFNLLGPLTNPAAAEHQLLGANSNRAARLIAGALARLGTQRAFVVCGNDQLDEVCLWGPTLALEVRSDGTVLEHTWQPQDFGLQPVELRALRVDSPQQSADLIRNVLADIAHPARDVVVANTAAALLAAGRCENLRQAAAVAGDTIRCGAARETLERLVAFTNDAA
ncbi:MAG: anthranilate phosphoribosyltransferase [Planctomycetota bacterium]|nr:MAG: anthranilate phosphoribosyltransferase [Planctomycetota bacterium]